MIHSTAVIHPGAQLDPSVEVGPCAVIDEGVSLGAHCRVGPHAYLTGRTRAGPHNRFYAGCVIGEAPQDVKYKDEPTELHIGGHNLFREGSTVHRSANLERATVIGSYNFLMVNSHVGHNVIVGDHIILANGALLAGYAQVGDRAFISGNCLVHQFVRVGTLALMQGGSAVSKDLPPFTVARGNNGICGLNVIGLRRAGFSPQERLDLKSLYHKLFRSRQNLSNIIAEAQKDFTSGPSKILLEFLASAKRGVCRDMGVAESDE